MAWTDWKNVPDNSAVTASASDVLTGKVIIDADGNKVSGSMPNNGVYICDADHIGMEDAGFYQQIPYGYYPARSSKTGYTYNYVDKNCLGDAAASNVLSGKTFTSANGVKLSGTMTNQTNNTGTVGLAWAGSTTGSPDGGSGWTQAGNQLRIPIPKGYYGSSTYSNWSCSGLVLNDFQNKLGITASKIVSGQSICGISGTGGGLKYFNKLCNISDGTWSGVTLSDSSYVAITSASKDSSFTYYHNLNLDISKIQYISWHIIETTNGIRVPRGVSGTSTAYAYQPRYGFSHKRSDFDNGDAYVSSFVFFDGAPAGAGSSRATAQLFVYPNYLKLIFANVGLNVPLAIKSTTPQFEFTIIYE